MECIGCKAFYENKNIKPGEERKCFICGKKLVKEMDVTNFFNDIFNNK